MKTVADIMQTDLVTIRTDASVRELTRLLADMNIGGVPVVDANGALRGVVSATDVVRRAAESGALDFQDDVVDVDAVDYYQPVDAGWNEWASVSSLREPEALTVEDIMTTVSFGVAPSTTLPGLADFLVRGRIHRALVMEGTRLVGLVTAMDVLKAVAEGL